MFGKLVVPLLALSSVAVGAPTAAQQEQARKDWADISVRSTVQAKYLCKLYLPRITVTKGAPVTQTITAGTAYVTETAAEVTETVTSGTATDSIAIRTLTSTTVTETETTTSTATETLYVATVTTTSSSCPTPVKRSLDGSGSSFRDSSVPALARRAKGESAEVVFNRIKANDPDYLTSVCSQLQTGRWTSAVRPTSTRSVQASGTVTETPTATTTVPATTILVTDLSTSTETAIVTETTATMTTETVTATATACTTSPPRPVCSVGYACGESVRTVVLPGGGMGYCITLANGQFGCTSNANCGPRCASDNTCSDGRICVVNTCCGYNECKEPC